MMEEKPIDRGVGEWLVLSYLPVSLFSLRMAHATSKGGKTLLVPTPYAFKMTMIDACFRVFNGDEAEKKARQVFDLIKGCEIRFNPPSVCIVQNTFVKIRQEERDAPKGFYVPTIAYREFCFYSNDELKVAVGVKGLSEEAIDMLRLLGSHINCIGKRGSFWQFVGDSNHKNELPEGFIFPHTEERLSTGNFQWFQYLDDFGEVLCKAKDGFDRISTYGDGKIELGKHRILVRMVLPYKFKQSSRHFTQYEKVASSAQPI